MPLKGHMHISLLANCLRLFSSCDNLMNELFTIWLHVPSNMAACGADRHQLFTVLILLFTYHGLHCKVALVSFIHTNFCITTRKSSGRTQTELVSVRTTLSHCQVASLDTACFSSFVFCQYVSEIKLQNRGSITFHSRRFSQGDGKMQLSYCH